MRRIVALFLFVIVISPPRIHFGGNLPERGMSPEILEPLAGVSNTFGIPKLKSEREAVAAFHPVAFQAPATDSKGLPEALQRQLEGPLDSEKISSANQWVSSLGLAEWLGPLAPVALSPFFGVTCLSGLSLWGPDWVTNNAMIGTSSVLRSQLLFFIFLVLTLLTSAPRFTKVSKPLAQAVDRLEAYSVIVILLTVKFAAASQASGDETVAMVQLGVVSFTLDTLLAIAMIINILVINSVKFFFEFMVWLTPGPITRRGVRGLQQVGLCRC